MANLNIFKKNQSFKKSEQSIIEIIEDPRDPDRPYILSELDSVIVNGMGLDTAYSLSINETPSFYKRLKPKQMEEATALVRKNFPFYDGFFYQVSVVRRKDGYSSLYSASKNRSVDYLDFIDVKNNVLKKKLLKREENLAVTSIIHKSQELQNFYLNKEQNEVFEKPFFGEPFNENEISEKNCRISISKSVPEALPHLFKDMRDNEFSGKNPSKQELMERVLKRFPIFPILSERSTYSQVEMINHLHNVIVSIPNNHNNRITKISLSDIKDSNLRMRLLEEWKQREINHIVGKYQAIEEFYCKEETKKIGNSIKLTSGVKKALLSGK